MVVCAAGYQTETTLGQTVSQSGCVCNNGLAVGLEFRFQRLAEADSLCSDHVHQRTALCAGEYCLVDLLCQFLVVGEDQTASRSTEGLMGGGGGDVSIRHRRRVNACGNQTGDVRHVYHQICAHRLCDLGQALEVDDAGICACAGNDQFRLDFLCQSLGTVVVDVLVIAQLIGNEVEVLAGDVDRRTVGQVTAVRQAHAHYGIARLEQCKVYGGVCLCAGVGLYIGILCAEQLAGTLNGDFLNHVNIFAAAVVALVGQTLCVLVGEGRTHRCHNCRRNQVLAGDQLQVAALATQLLIHCLSNFRVELGYKTNGVHHILVHGKKTPL